MNLRLLHGIYEIVVYVRAVQAVSPTIVSSGGDECHIQPYRSDLLPWACRTLLITRAFHRDEVSRDVLELLSYNIQSR